MLDSDMHEKQQVALNAVAYSVTKNVTPLLAQRFLY